jgi:alanine or glycine:cation symporter, AGCS family
MERLDQYFEKVNGAIASVLFFDFGTGQMPMFGGASIPFVVLWLLGGGIFLTIRMGFINLRAFKHAIDLVRGKFDDPKEPGEVTQFQALSSALSATVGLGNIGGVALAVGQGGPGATFWMIVVGVLGMSTKFAECSLGQIYRKVAEDGTVLGGPMRYLQVGLQDRRLFGFRLAGLGKVLAVVFAVLCVGASFGGGNSYQVSQSLSAIREAEALSVLKDAPWLYGLVMSLAVGAVIIGGIKSIGRVASRVVPLMCAAYLGACLVILGNYWQQIPAALVAIVEGAFRPDAMFAGGFWGVMVLGVRRAVFSNEAGVGSAAIAHSAAKTNEPISEGIVALLEPFIDTVVVCTITALVIGVTGVYTSDAGRELALDNQGAALTLMAFTTGGPQWFAYVLYVAVVLFAFSTCISWSYYGERCFVQLFGQRASMLYKLLFVGFTFLGSIITATNILEFSDLMILTMSLPNLLGVFLLSGLVRDRLHDYWDRYRAGQIRRTA